MYIKPTQKTLKSNFLWIIAKVYSLSCVKEDCCEESSRLSNENGKNELLC